MRVKHKIEYGYHEGEYYSWWAECKTHNWFTGFYHTKREARFWVRIHRRTQR